MGKSTADKLWSIKIVSNAAYLYKGGRQVEHFQHIVGAEPTESGESTKTLLKLEFVPSQNNTYKFASLNHRYFNKFDCDGVFKTIDCKSVEDLAEEIKKKVKDLDLPQERQQMVQTLVPQKRQLAPLYSASGSAASSKSKKQKRGETSHVHVKDIEEKCNECQLDNKTHFIPIEKLAVPPKKRQIRTIDECFLQQLVNNIKDQPAGNYEALFVVVKGINSKESFRHDEIAEYDYEVLGGTHLTLATRQLHNQFPDNQNYRGRVARIYVGLKDEEALWLGAMHNNTGAFRHHLTYKDEVEICRTQLFLPVQNCSDDPPQPPDSWRDMCASLLNKTKRNLSEVFTMAQLSGEGWKHFQTLNTMFENAQLKGQKAKATDIVKKGKPVLKQWQLKSVCSLSTQDRAFLLEKITQQEMSLEELKSAANEIKSLRPIQEAIVAFFKVNSWEELKVDFGQEVSAERLLRFAGKDFEQSHDFQKFLERLKRKKEGGDGVEVADIISGQSGALGLTIFTRAVMDIEQNAVAKLPHYEGAFLAIGDAGENCKDATDVIGLVSRVNFTKLTSFNIVLFTTVDDVKTVKCKMGEGGATLSQTGHFYVQNKPPGKQNQGHFLRESLTTFVIGHWSVSRQVTDRHLSISGNMDNLVLLENEAPHTTCSERVPPLGAFTWLVKHLSRVGDAVIDVNSSAGSALVAALKEGRNAVWLSTAPPDSQPMLQTSLSNRMSSAVNQSSETTEEVEPHAIEL